MLEQLKELGTSTKEQRASLHKRMIELCLKKHPEGLTANGVKKWLDAFADIELHVKYGDALKRLKGKQSLKQEIEADRSALTLSVPRIIEVLEELRVQKRVERTVLNRNYHVFKLTDLGKRLTGIPSLLGLLLAAKSMPHPFAGRTNEAILEEMVNRVGLYVVFIFLGASTDTLKGLDQADREKVRYGYVREATSMAYVYSLLKHVFYDEKSEGVTQREANSLLSSMRKKYPDIMKNLDQGALAYIEFLNKS